MRRPVRWSPEDEARLRELWYGPDTLIEIGRKMGRLPSGICEKARRIGLPPRITAKTNPVREKVRDLLADGLTLAEIGRALGKHPSNLYRTFRGPR